MNKYLLRIASIALTVPSVALAAEWHLVGDNNLFPYKQVPVVGAVLVDSIKKYEDHVEAQISMFDNYDLAQTVTSKLSKSDFTSKVKSAIASGRANAYAGMANSFKTRGAGFLSFTDDQIPTALVASEILIEEGEYAPKATATIQLRCNSKQDFQYRYSEEENWSSISYGKATDPKRATLYPYICDKAGIGQNEPAPPPPPSPEVALLQSIGSGARLPKWKFLGNYIDYGARSFVFFASDTIQKKNGYIDVVVGKFQNSTVQPALFVSWVQNGRYLPVALETTHVHCDKEEINFSPWAKLFETQLVSYVCAHTGKP